MGNRTSFKLEINISNESEKLEIINKLRNFSDGAEMAFDINGTPYEEIKWYDHNEELIEFSKKYPDVLFILDGCGEEHGDVWRTYYKNGKIQHAEMIFTDFDEKKLMDY